MDDMAWILSFLLGLIGAILLCAILNGSKATRKLGLVLALFAACFMISHDGDIIPATRNYSLDEMPFLLILAEGFLDFFLITFPIVRALVGYGNFVNAHKNDNVGKVLNKSGGFAHAITVIIKSLLR